MGNQPTSESPPWTSHKLADNFVQNNNLFMMEIDTNSEYCNWKWNLSPLESYHRYLFLPTNFEQAETPQNNCCTNVPKQCLEGNQKVRVWYQPFIYTLHGEILARRDRNQRFREAEIWKILKVGALAIKDWSRIYPDLSLGPINPKSVLFNSNGNAKIVNRFSFPFESTQQKEDLFPLGVNGETPVSESIYSLGKCLLDAITLNQDETNYMGFEEKKKYFYNSNLYNIEIKELILHMLQTQSGKRANLQQIISALLYYKQISKENGK